MRAVAVPVGRRAGRRLRTAIVYRRTAIGQRLAACVPTARVFMIGLCPFKEREMFGQNFRRIQRLKSKFCSTALL